jgi:hypothetical protein
MNRSTISGSCKYEVCGQGNVINLFREEDKRGKKFLAKRANRKGNFARERSRDARANFYSDRGIAQICSGSHRARSQFFAPQGTNRRDTAERNKNFLSIEKKFSISTIQCRNQR